VTGGVRRCERARWLTRARHRPRADPNASLCTLPLARARDQSARSGRLPAAPAAKRLAPALSGGAGAGDRPKSSQPRVRHEVTPLCIFERNVQCTKVHLAPLVAVGPAEPRRWHASLAGARLAVAARAAALRAPGERPWTGVRGGQAVAGRQRLGEGFIPNSAASVTGPPPHLGLRRRPGNCRQSDPTTTTKTWLRYSSFCRQAARRQPRADTARPGVSAQRLSVARARRAGA
jgi:hypothetical protein